MRTNEQVWAMIDAHQRRAVEARSRARAALRGGAVTQWLDAFQANDEALAAQQAANQVALDFLKSRIDGKLGGVQ